MDKNQIIKWVLIAGAAYLAYRWLQESGFLDAAAPGTSPQQKAGAGIVATLPPGATLPAARPLPSIVAPPPPPPTPQSEVVNNGDGTYTYRGYTSFTPDRAISLYNTNFGKTTPPPPPTGGIAGVRERMLTASGNANKLTTDQWGWYMQQVIGVTATPEQFDLALVGTCMNRAAQVDIDTWLNSCGGSSLYQALIGGMTGLGWAPQLPYAAQWVV
jgi:hypothetical protein